METNTSNIQETGALTRASDFVRSTGRNVFLTGKAGTGKTTFLQRIRSLSEKRMIVVAPTGVAAINAGGVTIHSFFQLPFGPQIPEAARQTPGGRFAAGDKLPGGIRKFNREKLRIIRALDLLVIDEISMVRADLLDSVDEVLRKLRRSSLPFGGVQLLVIGDLFQLSPVVRDEDWSLLRDYYPSMYFFDSLAYKRADFITVELDHVFRQRDEQFINLLNAVRNNTLTPSLLEMLNQRYVPHPDQDMEGYITLTTHNARAFEINQHKLAALSSPERSYSAVVEGDFPETSFPGEKELKLKIGAQVMFTKNDPDIAHRYYNGKIGRLIEFRENTVVVRCSGDDDVIEVKPVIWFNHQYHVDEVTMEVVEEVSGTFTQLPLKLAWAITIHKSQGLTFERAIIDARAAFASGQVYVALSRCRTLDGLVLSSRIDQGGIITDQNVMNFTNNTSASAADEQTFLTARSQFQLDMMKQLFDFSSLVHHYRSLRRHLQTHAASLEQRQIAPMLEFEPVFSEVKMVAERFTQEINSFVVDDSIPEENPRLQERVRKAAGWFSEKIKTSIWPVLGTFSIASDNAAVRNIIRESLDVLRKEVNLKMTCLEYAVEGFSALRYLNVKGKVVLELSEAPDRKLGKSIDNLDFMAHPLLFKELLKWRNNIAGERKIATGKVVPQRTLIRIAEVLPADENSLSAIKGVSRRMMQDFGADLLGMIRQYCKEKDVPQVKTMEISQEHIKKNAGFDSKKISFDLYKSGKSIPEIAAGRGLAKSTIETHLLFYLEAGKIAVNELVPEQKFRTIADYFLSPENTDSLSMAKDFLGEDYSYGELRFVLHHLRQLHSKS